MQVGGRGGVRVVGDVIGDPARGVVLAQPRDAVEEQQQVELRRAALVERLDDRRERPEKR